RSTMVPPSRQPASSRLSGTSVVLPAPGGATSTALLPRSSAVRRSARTTVTGSSGSETLLIGGSDRLPAVMFAGTEDGVDDLLVQNRFLQREDAVCPSASSPHERLDLKAILLRAGEAEQLRRIVVLVVQRHH